MNGAANQIIDVDMYKQAQNNVHVFSGVPVTQSDTSINSTDENAAGAHLL
jgi:hypothetical protein